MLVNHYGLPIRSTFDCGKGNCEECSHYDKTIDFCKYDDDYHYYKEQYYAELDYESSTPEQRGEYTIEIMNNDGYYDNNGFFHRYKEI